MLHSWRPERRCLCVLAAWIGVLFGGAERIAPVRGDDNEGPIKVIRQAEPVNQGTSLDWIPADASFYHASLRNREWLEGIANSQAWTKIKGLPAAQLYWKKLQEELSKQDDNPIKQYQEFVKDPENRQLVELFGDMLSREYFVYTDAGFVDLMNLTMQINSASRFGPALTAVTGQNTDLDSNAQQAVLLLRTLSENRDRLKIPNLIVGFQLSDKARAEAQLKRLQTTLEPLLAAPPLKDRIKPVKIDGQTFLTLSLDGKMIPWDMISLKEFEGQPGEFDKLVKKLKSLTFTIALGVRGQHLLLSVGASTDPLANLGKGKRLSDRPELQPLAKLAGKPLTRITYLSADLANELTTNARDIDAMADMAGQYLKKADLPSDVRDRLQKDLDELARDAKTYFPKSGAHLGFSFTSPRGWESYSYDWSERPARDGSRPLTLLDHIGGTPLFAVVNRVSYDPESYRRVVKWIKKANDYFDELAVPKLEDEQKEQYKQFAKLAFPLLKRFDDITDKMLLPSLADGQSALVIDAKLSSKQWFKQLPALKSDLRFPEPALVKSISDRDLFKKALEGYRTLINDTAAVIDKANGGEASDFKIPAPEVQKVKLGEIFYYSLPADLGLDRRIMPNFALSETTAVMSLTREHSERLLAKVPLKADLGLIDANRPLVRAVYLDWAGTVDFLAPWVEMGVRQSAAELLPEDTPAGEGTEALLQQTRIVFNLLKVFREYSSVTYVEGKALVTHGEAVVRDLP